MHEMCIYYYINQCDIYNISISEQSLNLSLKSSDALSQNEFEFDWLNQLRTESQVVYIR